MRIASRLNARKLTKKFLQKLKKIAKIRRPIGTANFVICNKFDYMCKNSLIFEY